MHHTCLAALPNNKSRIRSHQFSQNEMEGIHFSKDSFIYLKPRERGEEIDQSSSYWFTLQPDLAQAKARSLELHPGLPYA